MCIIIIMMVLNSNDFKAFLHKFFYIFTFELCVFFHCTKLFSQAFVWFASNSREKFDIFFGLLLLWHEQWKLKHHFYDLSCAYLTLLSFLFPFTLFSSPFLRSRISISFSLNSPLPHACITRFDGCCWVLFFCKILIPYTTYICLYVLV